MDILSEIKGVFSHNELDQVQVIPSAISTTAFQKHSEDDYEEDDDMSAQEWSDHCFDMYAKQYHSLDPQEREEFIRSQDTYWMMQ